MSIAEDGTVAGKLGLPPQPVPFKGRLDLARMRVPDLRSQ
jgi:hypothetical protein